MRVLQLHIADGRVETDDPVTMSGHCSLSIGIAQQTLQSSCREMWRIAFSIQFLSSNYAFHIRCPCLEQYIILQLSPTANFTVQMSPRHWQLPQAHPHTASSYHLKRHCYPRLHLPFDCYLFRQMPCLPQPPRPFHRKLLPS